MREIRQSGSEGGGTAFNRFSLPLSPNLGHNPLVNCYLPVKRRAKLIEHARTIPGENREPSPGLRRSDGDNALRKRHLPDPLFR
jgi:hypothetical protein